MAPAALSSGTTLAHTPHNPQNIFSTMQITIENPTHCVKRYVLPRDLSLRLFRKRKTAKTFFRPVALQPASAVVAPWHMNKIEFLENLCSIEIPFQFLNKTHCIQIQMLHVRQNAKIYKKIRNSQDCRLRRLRRPPLLVMAAHNHANRIAKNVSDFWYEYGLPR